MKQLPGREIWERDASYDYYSHGPLRRSVTGQDAVQGTDYVYTLQGWLKSINHPIVAANNNNLDPGRDGSTGYPNNNIGVDAFGSTLTYYNGDFAHGTSAFNSITGIGPTSATAPINNRNLYNGNIAGWVTGYDNGTAGSKPLAGIYRYNLLNRIREDKPKEWNAINSTWNPINGTGYNTLYSYDPNGNITHLERTNKAGDMFDILSYTYGDPSAPDPTNNNRLKKVADASTVPGITYDLEDQTATQNYTYDNIGNLINDAQAGNAIEWTASGKVSKVTQATQTISFLYDGMGNRVRKFVDKTGTNDDVTTWYVRDASGNVMAIYDNKKEESNPNQTIRQVEVPLYGSDRVGLRKPYELTRGTITAVDIFSRDLGIKQYELKDHLGNVRVVLGDIKTNTDNVAPFKADVVSYNNYFPYGMQMYDDTWQSSLYRYGYNKGSEKDDEISGSGNHITTLYREGDIRVSNWWSVDPKASIQPWQSPYSFMDGNPIKNNDADGDVAGWDNVFGAIIGAGVDYGFQVAGNVNEKGWSVNAFTNVDPWSIAASAAAGFITSGASSLETIMVKQAAKELTNTIIKKELTRVAIHQVVNTAESIAKKVSKNYNSNSKNPLFDAFAKLTLGSYIDAARDGAFATGSSLLYLPRKLTPKSILIIDDALAAKIEQLSAKLKAKPKGARSHQRKVALKQAKLKQAVRNTPGETARETAENTSQNLNGNGSILPKAEPNPPEPTPQTGRPPQ